MSSFQTLLKSSTRRSKVNRPGGFGVSLTSWNSVAKFTSAVTKSVWVGGGGDFGVDVSWCLLLPQSPALSVFLFIVFRDSQSDTNRLIFSQTTITNIPSTKKKKTVLIGHMKATNDCPKSYIYNNCDASEHYVTCHPWHIYYDC